MDGIFHVVRAFDNDEVIGWGGGEGAGKEGGKRAGERQREGRGESSMQSGPLTMMR